MGVLGYEFLALDRKECLVMFGCVLRPLEKRRSGIPSENEASRFDIVQGVKSAFRVRDDELKVAASEDLIKIDHVKYMMRYRISFRKGFREKSRKKVSDAQSSL